jgi:hypothetical protein
MALPFIVTSPKVIVPDANVLIRLAVLGEVPAKVRDPTRPALLVPKLVLEEIEIAPLLIVVPPE